jgi:hypothetical protein
VSFNAAHLELCAANIKALDQPVFDSKHVTDHFIREKVAVEIADDLMVFCNDFPFGAIPLNSLTDAMNKVLGVIRAGAG